MSRGTIRRRALGRLTRTVPNSSRSVTKASPSGPPMKPPLRLRSTSVTAPGGGASADPTDDADRVIGLGEQVGEARRLVRGEDDPLPVLDPAVDGFDQTTRTAGRHDRFAPAELVARREPAAGHRRVLRRLGFPRHLERSRGDEAALPVTRRQVGGRPVLRQLTGGDELGTPLVGLPPQELGGLGDVARLIEDEERARVEMVEPGGRGEVGGPDLGRVADGHGTACGWRRRGRRCGRPVPERIEHVPVESREIGRKALGKARRRASETVPDRRGAIRGEEELRSGQQHGAIDDADGSLVCRVEGAERVDLVAEELDPDRQRQRRREDVDDAAAAGGLAAARDFGDRDVAEVEQLMEQRVLVEARSWSAAREARPGDRPG